jgi:quinoprotein glucose dehydrogenase
MSHSHIYDPRLYEALPPQQMGFLHRGLAYWSDGCGTERLFLATRAAILVALDPRTLRPIEDLATRARSS